MYTIIFTRIFICSLKYHAFIFMCFFIFNNDPIKTVVFFFSVNIILSIEKPVKG